jgi:L-lactate dehydrogenase complex protein LldE
MDGHNPHVRVGLFVTCLVDQLRPSTGIAAVRLLRRLGVDVVFPQAQGCCGQPALNSGDPEHARAAARTQFRAFEDCDWIVVPSGSCTGMMREHTPSLFHGHAEAHEAAALAARTLDISEFLVQVLKLRELPGRSQLKVTWHGSCHGRRIAKLGNEAERLLASIQGLELVPLPRAEDCCGFGGSFCATFPELSAAMGAEKCAHVRSTNAQVLTGNDTGCLLHMESLLRHQGSRLPVKHWLELAEEASRTGASC